jgi:hypothetical protein
MRIKNPMNISSGGSIKAWSNVILMTSTQEKSGAQHKTASKPSEGAHLTTKIAPLLQLSERKRRRTGIELVPSPMLL